MASAIEIESKSTILIVDDNEAEREALQGLLAGQGYTLALAKSGEDALARALTLRPDLVLLDVLMPGMSGFEVCRCLRATPGLAEVPIIIVTSLDDPGSRAQGIEAGADDFIPKPCDPIELRTRVRAITRLNRYRRLLMERAQRQEAEEKVRLRNQELATLNAIARVVNQSLDRDQILEDALGEILDLDALQGNAGVMVFLLDEATGTLSIAAYRGVSADHPCIVDPSRTRDCLCGEAVTRGEVCVSENCQMMQGQEGTSTMDAHRDICLPLAVGGRMLGVLKVWFPLHHTLSEHGLGLWKSVSDLISAALDKARLFEQVKQQHEALRALAARLAETEQAERQQLARELHDQVGQNLAALGINLNILRAQIPAGKLAHLVSRLDDSLALVEQTSERIRNVMAELRPPVLDDYGLEAALRWYSVQCTARTGIAIDVRGAESDARMPSSVENALFRIAQEALNNIVKHARATAVIVDLDADSDRIRIEITDDGVGFDAASPMRPAGHQGWGLLIMAERAEAVGGTCRIESHPQAGTSVIVEVPQ